MVVVAISYKDVGRFFNFWVPNIFDLDVARDRYKPRFHKNALKLFAISASG